MPAVNVVVIVATVIVVAAVIVWFATTRKQPEKTAGHADAPPWTTSEQLSAGADRPAGPDAEAMSPDLLGGDQRLPESTAPEADAYDD